jgi:hypothetical protein
VTKYGQSLNLDLEAQTLTAQAEVPLVETEETLANGLMTMSEAGIQQNIETMVASGIEVTAEDLFDTSLLEEIYKDGNRVA